MNKDSFSQILYYILRNSVRTIFYFPVWWYTKGFLKVVKGGWEFIKDYNLTLGFTIWLKNLFVPMFGQKDIAGRLISFVLRLVQIIIRGIALFIIAILTILFVCVWLVLPVFVIIKILTYHLNV